MRSSSVFCLVRLVLLSSLAACGGSTPAANVPSGGGTAGALAEPSTLPAEVPEPETQASVVRFEDLGIVFPVPPGYRVLGDEELSARVRASANVKLDRSLRERASQKKGLPLLTLERLLGDANDFLTVSLSVILVPKDARASELIAHEQVVMAEHLAGYKLVSGPKARVVSGVEGSELESVYLIKRAGESRRVASSFRLFVQGGLATVLVAVWPEGSPREEEARLVLDGLAFEPPLR